MSLKHQHALLLLSTTVLLVLIAWTVHYTSAVYPNSPTSIIFIGNGQTAQAGFITDVNNDGLPDFVVSYYQRDYNFAVTTLFLNNGCFYVRHSSPFQPLEYCREYFVNKQMLDWQLRPPTVNITIPSERFIGVIQLPYHAADLPILLERVFKVKIRTPHKYFFKAGTPIQYHAISGGDHIEYLINPANAGKFSDEDPGTPTTDQPVVDYNGSNGNGGSDTQGGPGTFDPYGSGSSYIVDKQQPKPQPSGGRGGYSY